MTQQWNPALNHSEFLADDEIVNLTGYKLASKQIEWLANHGWQYALTRARRPVVGRIYARLKLAGVRTTSINATKETWALDLSRVG